MRPYLSFLLSEGLQMWERVAGRQSGAYFSVCEHLADKSDAADAPLSQQTTLASHLLVDFITSSNLFDSL